MWVFNVLMTIANFCMTIYNSISSRKIHNQEQKDKKYESTSHLMNSYTEGRNEFLEQLLQLHQKRLPKKKYEDMRKAIKMQFAMYMSGWSVKCIELIKINQLNFRMLKNGISSRLKDTYDTLIPASNQNRKIKYKDAITYQKCIKNFTKALTLINVI